MTTFRKTVAASSVAAAIAGLSGPANALIEGSAGEALLVPFALYDSGQDAPVFIPEINTLVEVTVPAQVGFDTIPAFFTAPNSTPTNLNNSLLPGEPALGLNGDFTAGVHLYAFNQRSVEVFNTEIPTSPDDFIMINWGDFVVNNAPFLDGQKVYLVITNEKSDPTYYPFGWLDDARFAMFGDAFMVWNPVPGIGLIDTKIPVLPMSDGANAFGDVPTTQDNVVFNSDGSIAAVSPLSSGMRTNLSNGTRGDFTLFDLTMSNRFAPTLHVIWVDQNIGQTVTQFVYDDDEQQCSQPIPIPNELNVYWTSPALLHPHHASTSNPSAGSLLATPDCLGSTPRSSCATRIVAPSCLTRASLGNCSTCWSQTSSILGSCASASTSMLTTTSVCPSRRPSPSASSCSSTFWTRKAICCSPRNCSRSRPLLAMSVGNSARSKPQD